MKKSTWFYLGPLIILLLLMLGFSVWVFFLKKPIPGVDCRKRSGWVWDKSCKFFEEKFFDSSLKDPSDLQLYLVRFQHVKGAGPPLCLPLWYCFRYVNVKTGGYSNFSKWTAGPIKSGATSYPCIDGMGKCDPNKVSQNPRDNCRYNQPLIGIPDLQYNPTKRTSDGSFIYANIHRYTGNLDTKTPPEKPSNENTQIIGYLIPNSSINGIKYAWSDILFNPCKNNPKCGGRCPGC